MAAYNRHKLVLLTILAMISLTVLGCDQATIVPSPSPAPLSASPTALVGPITDGADIIRRAQAVPISPTFASMVLTYTVRGSDGGVSDQGRVWYQAPNRWRVETKYRLVLNSGPSPLQVSDGTSIWNYDPSGNFVNIGDLSNVAGSPPFFPLSGAVINFKLNDCPAPRLLGSDTVASRAAYKVALGQASCVQFANPNSGDWVVWIDQQTFLELGEQSGYVSPGPASVPTPAPQAATKVVTAITYNLAIDPAEFSFTAPAGINVRDERALSLAVVRQRVSFPIFVPTILPITLTSELPLLRDKDAGPLRVDIYYHSADGQAPLDVTNSAIDRDISASAQRGQGVKLANGAIGYFSRTAPECNDGEGALSLYWEQQGTAITLRTPQYDSADGVQLSRDELLQIAAGVSSRADLSTTAPRPQLTARLPSPLPTGSDCVTELPPAPPTEPAQPQPTSTPIPTPDLATVEGRISDWARQASYPIFLPDYVPEGMALSQNLMQLSFDPSSGLQVNYVPTNPAPTFVPNAYAPPQPGFTIQERPADYNNMALGWGEGVNVTGGHGWLQRGISGGYGGASLIFLREGTQVQINSFYIDGNALLRIANSLAPLPGGHPPLPAPVPFTLAEIRAQLPIPVFIPTDLPVGLNPEPPTVAQQSFPSMMNFGGPRYAAVSIIYHSNDGSFALMVRNGMADIGYSDPSQPDHPTLPNGISADFISLPASEGGPLLQWTQEGSHIDLSGPQQTRDSLLKIAATMSKTADLGITELPTSRPTTTPAPPTFTLLRPMWLPQANMSDTEWADPNSPQPGANIVLAFDDPILANQPHIPLILREIKRGVYAEGLPDPGAARKTIGGQELFISGENSACFRITWTQNDVDLTITNAYNLQGLPRYSCNDLEQMAVSVR